MKEWKPKHIQYLFAALDKAIRERNFIHLDKFVEAHGCTENQLETWAKENQEYNHILDMTRARIVCNAKHMALLSEISIETYGKVIKNHDPEEWKFLQDFLSHGIDN